MEKTSREPDPSGRFRAFVRGFHVVGLHLPDRTACRAGAPALAFNGIRFIRAALLLALIISVFYRREGKLLSSLCILGDMLLAELKSAG
ncbi:hypothetical protein [Paenibacillus phocaensis]|uniref:hypothetical protein n=1 Tax=Paenibacillus phocaensis TaxID=1776378 RepID=UPI000839D212